MDRHICALLTCLLLGGCFSRPEMPPLPPTPGVPPSPGAPPAVAGTPESATIDALKAEKAKADAAAAEWAARAETLGKAIKDERQAAEEALRAHQRAWLGYLAVWTVGLCTLLFGACIFLLVWLGVAIRRLAVAGMVTFGLMGLLAGAYLLLQSLITTLATTLLWVVFGVVCLGLVAAVGYGVATLARWKRATAAAAHLADQVMEAPASALRRVGTFRSWVEEAKAAAAQTQDRSGVRALVAAARGKTRDRGKNA